MTNGVPIRFLHECKVVSIIRLARHEASAFSIHIRNCLPRLREVQESTIIHIVRSSHSNLSISNIEVLLRDIEILFHAPAPPTSAIHSPPYPTVIVAPVIVGTAHLDIIVQSG